jgi:hypothetical protein
MRPTGTLSGPIMPLSLSMRLGAPASLAVGGARAAAYLCRVSASTSVVVRCGGGS